MPDTATIDVPSSEPITVSGVPEGTTQVTIVPPPSEMAVEMDRMRADAEKFIKSLPAEEEGATEAPPTPEARPRGPDGKFLPTAQKPEPAPTAHLDPAWVFAAEQEDMTPEQIQAFKTSDELQRHIVDKRVKALTRAGVDIKELQEFREAKKAKAVASATVPVASVPQHTPVVPVPTTDKPFKLELNEEEFSPEHVKVFRTLEQQVNEARSALTPVMLENKQLREQFAALQGELKQSAEQRQAAELAQREAVLWDKAAAEIPGFVEAFGMKPSELERLSNTNPHDQRVLDFMAWGTYFKPLHDSMVSINGPSEAVRIRAMKEAFARSPFYGKAHTNGNGATTNGKHTPGQVLPGSVIAGSRQRTDGQSPVTTTNPMEAERERIIAEVGKAWAQHGMNPYTATLQQA